MKSVCKVCVLLFEDSDLDEHLNQHMEEPEETQSELKAAKCKSVCFIRPRNHE